MAKLNKKLKYRIQSKNAGAAKNWAWQTYDQFWIPRTGPARDKLSWGFLEKIVFTLSIWSTDKDVVVHCKWADLSGYFGNYEQFLEYFEIIKPSCSKIWRSFK